MNADLPYEQRLINYQAAQIKALTLQCHLLRLELHLSNAERWLWPNIQIIRQQLEAARESYDAAVLDVYAAKQAMR